MATEMNTLQAGFHRMVVTPPLGAKIPGYFKTRIADGIISDLYINATAFYDGQTKAIIFSCDAISIEEDAYAMISAKIAERCGVEPGAVYIHATHSHTAFRIIVPETMKPGANEQTVNGDPVYAAYFPHLMQMFCDCAQFAFEDLKPCTFKIARGQAERISFNRRYEMKDGTFKTNPSHGHPDLLRTAGPVDEGVQILRIIREEAKEIILVNFGTHPDTVNGTKYCADWPGFTVDNIRNAFNGTVEAVLLNGAQGDVNHFDRFTPPKPPAGTYSSKRMAHVLAGEVLKIYDSAVEIPTGPIRYYAKTARIGKNTHDPATEPLALEMYKHYQEFLKTDVKDAYLLNTENHFIAKENRTMSIPEAVRIVKLLDAPEFFDIQITGLQIGQVGFIGIPGEPFTEIGMRIKDGSKLDMTFVNCLVNGSRGYFPTAAAFAVAGYERSTSRFAHNCAQLVIDAGLEIRSEMEG